MNCPCKRSDVCLVGLVATTIIGFPVALLFENISQIYFIPLVNYLTFAYLRWHNLLANDAIRTLRNSSCSDGLHVHSSTLILLPLERPVA